MQRYFPAANRRMPRPPCRTERRGDGIEGDIRPQEYLESLRLEPSARLLPLRIRERVGPRNDRYDVADDQRDDMMPELGGRHALLLQGAGCDCNQPLEFAAELLPLPRRA